MTKMAMKLLFTGLIMLAAYFAAQAQGSWKSSTYWGNLNIQFFAREITFEPSNYKADKKTPTDWVSRKKAHIFSDTLAMYIYRNKKDIRTGGMASSDTRNTDLTFSDSSFSERESKLIELLHMVVSNKDVPEKPPYNDSKQLSILFNDKALFYGLNMDSILAFAEGTKWGNLEVVKRAGVKMLFYKTAMKYQDEVIIKVADLKTGIETDEYTLSHNNPFPRLINYYNLNQKNIFDVINNRDSIQLNINDSSFGKFESDKLTQSGDSSMQLTLQQFTNGSNVRIKFRNIEVQQINLKPDENNILLLFNRFSGTDTLKLLYQFIDEEKSDTSWHMASDVFILQFTNLLPGKKYVLKVKYNLTPYAVSNYIFFVEIKWWQTLWFKMLLSFVVGSSLISVGWLVYRSRQKKRLIKEQEEKKQLNIQFDAVRAQLNPHFIFNALASVQSLMNKNDVHQANLYLSEISLLMRETLEYSQKAMIAIRQELDMIRHYIEIEQLRFPFQYAIAIDDAIDPDIMELPAMLLQPIVENSIKHALSGMDKAKIEIRVWAADKKLYIVIADNGKGFDKKKGTTKGHGLRLTEERIVLFNKLHPYSPVEFIVTSQLNAGTTITFVFNNWINT